MSRGRKPFFATSASLRGGVQPLLETLGSSACDADRDGALRSLLAQTWLWAPGVVGRRFAFVSPDLHDLIEDAVQHLAVVAADGKYSAECAASEASAVGWCKKVVVNFVRDELRRRQRASARPPEPTPPESADAVVEKREAFRALVRGLRAEVRSASRRCDVRRRVALLDEFLHELVVAETREPVPSHLRQRRSRHRRLAREAWRVLKGRGEITREMQEIAWALGLEQTPRGTAGLQGPVPAGGRLAP